MKTALPQGRDADGFDRALAWCVVFLISLSALVFAPGVPFPTSLQRHITGLGLALCGAVICVRALAGRGLAIPPLPYGSIAIVGALGFTLLLPDFLSQAYSRERALLTAASALGLLGAAAASRVAARAHLGAMIFSYSFAVAGAVAGIGLLEAAGFDPLNARLFYEVGRNPVSTLGNPDLTSQFLAACGASAFAFSCSRGGLQRALSLLASILCAAHVGVLGVRFSQIALVVGVLAGIVCTWRRVRTAAPTMPTSGAVLPAAAGAAVVLGAMLLCTTLLGRRYDAPREPVGDGPAIAASAPSASSWPIPTTLEVRVRIAVATAKLMLVQAPFGAGAGNYAIAFALVRDPEEIEISTHRRRDTAESVVDHAHNDYLQFLAETGAIGVLALGLLAVGLRRWLREGVFSATPNTVAAAAGISALAICALGHSPIYDLPATGILAAFYLGVLGAADAAHPELWLGKGARAAGALLFLLIPFPAWLAARACEADVLVAFERVAPEPKAPRLVRAAELSRTDERLALMLARRRKAEGDVAGAVAAYGEALRRHPFLVEALLNRGVMLAEAGDHKSALLDFEKCRLVDAHHPRLAYNRAVLARSQGNDSEAAASLERAIELGSEPRDLKAWGMAFFESGAYERAIPYLDRWTARKPDDADVWFRLGTCFLKKNDRRSADLDFARAHRLYALQGLKKSDFTAVARSLKLYKKSSGLGDAGPAVLEAAMELAQGNRDAAAAALGRAESEHAAVEPNELKAPELEPLLQDAELGPRIRALARSQGPPK